MTRLSTKVISLRQPRLAIWLERVRQKIGWNILANSERLTKKNVSKSELQRIMMEYIARIIGGKNFTRDAQRVENIFPKLATNAVVERNRLEKEEFIRALNAGKLNAEQRLDTIARFACTWTGLVRAVVYQLEEKTLPDKVEYYLVFKASNVDPNKYDPATQERVVHTAKTIGFAKFYIGSLSKADAAKLSFDQGVQESFLKGKGLVVRSLFTKSPYLIYNKAGLPVNSPYDDIDRALLATTGLDIQYTMGSPILDQKGMPFGMILAESDERNESINNSILNCLAKFSKLSQLFPWGDKVLCKIDELQIEKAFFEILLAIDQIRAQAQQGLIRNTTELILRFIDSRDQENVGHSRRVFEYATMFANEVDLSPKERQVLDESIFHDIGKIAIPDSILNKKGPLTDPERQVIQSHTREGEKQLTQNIYFGAIYALYHHENYAWSLYENRKLKEPWVEDNVRINLLVSIVQIADRFDTITTNRPYKKASSLDYALRELFLGTYSEFQPVVAAAALRAFSMNIEKFHKMIEETGSLERDLPLYRVALSELETLYPIQKIIDDFTDKKISDPKEIKQALALLKDSFRQLFDEYLKPLKNMALDAEGRAEIRAAISRWGNEVLSKKLG